MIANSQKALVAYSLLAISILTVSLLFFRFTAEDAFIVARYSANLMDYGVLHFNPGDSISALTSPLHALLLTLFYAITSQTVAGFKIFTLCLLLASIAAVVFYIKEIYLRIFVLTTFSYSGVILWTFGGLETPILLFFITLLTLLVYKQAWKHLNGLIAIAVLAGLCFLTRYDSVLFTGPMLLIIIFRLKKLSNRLLMMAIPSLISLSWLIFSFFYFGDILPTSFYEKTPSVSNDGYIFVLTNLSKSGISISIIILLTFHLLRNYSDMGRNVVILSTIQCLFLSIFFIALMPLSLMVDWILLSPYLYLINVILLMMYLIFRDHQLWQQVWNDLKTGIVSIIWILPSILLVLGYSFTSAYKHMMFNSRMFVPYLPAMILAVALYFQTIGDSKAPDKFRQTLLILAYLLIALNFTHSIYSYVYSVNGIGNIGHEYQTESVIHYADVFMPILSENADDIQAHWEEQGNPDEKPRLITFAAGILPYTLRDYYIYGTLISTRSNCQPEQLAGYAHYIHILSPKLGTVEEQLGTLLDDLILISSYEQMFAGELNTFSVYYNPSPQEHILPATFTGECDY